MRGWEVERSSGNQENREPGLGSRLSFFIGSHGRYLLGRTCPQTYLSAKSPWTDSQNSLMEIGGRSENDGPIGMVFEADGITDLFQQLPGAVLFHGLTPPFDR